MKMENIPFAPKRWPFPYGWWILAIGTLGVIMSAPGQTIGVAAFIEPMMESIRLSRPQISLAYGIGTMLSAAMLTVAGKLYDRVGARPTGALAAVGLGTTLAVLSQIDHIYLALQRWPHERLASVCFGGLLVLGFFGVRFFGQGMLTLVSRNMVMKWFLHYRGLANGIMGVFIGLAFSSSPVLFHALITRSSWQQTWGHLALALGVGFAAVVLLFYRDNPQACGLVPDGGRPPHPHDPQHGPARSFTLKETIATPVFWAFGLSLALQALYGTAFAFHVESIMVGKGFAADMVYRVFLPASLIAVVLGLVAGWISDHVQLKALLLTQQGGMALSILALLLDRSTLTFPMLVFGNGVSAAMFGILLGVTWPRYFGQQHLGAITGFQMTFNVIFSAIGPALYAWVLHTTGQYHAANALCLVATVALAILALLVQPPAHHHKPA